MQKGFERFDKTRKIRSISLDTNVLSDVPYYFALERKGKLDKKEKSYLQRLESSVESIILILSINVKPMGIDIIKKEIKKKPLFLELYDHVFEKQVTVNKDIKWLANSYMKKINIDVPDALILAATSVGKIDLFLSWNRKDIVNENNLRIISAINKKRNVPFPVFATPMEFLERVFLTNRKTIGISQLPVPLRYRLKIFQTK